VRFSQLGALPCFLLLSTQHLLVDRTAGSIVLPYIALNLFHIQRPLKGNLNHSSFIRRLTWIFCI